MSKEEKDYGTPTTIDEMVGHYESHFLKPEQFRELLEGMVKKDADEPVAIEDIHIGFMYEEYQLDSERYLSKGMIWVNKTYNLESPKLRKMELLIKEGKIRARGSTLEMMDEPEPTDAEFSAHIEEQMWDMLNAEGITKGDVSLVDLEIAFSPVIPLRGGEPTEAIETKGGEYLLPHSPIFKTTISAEMLKIMRYRYLISKR